MLVERLQSVIQMAYGMLTILVLSCQTSDRSGPQPAVTSLTRDPLPSWNDRPVKQAIISYIDRVTDTTSSDFIPVKDRIATFDNDGTLWAERPYVQELFAFYRVSEMVKKDPVLVRKQPFKSVVENDKTYFTKGGEKALIQLLNATHTGTSEEEFELSVERFFATATYPVLNVPVEQAIYRPQIELLSYLRSNGFKTYICTGGTIEFVRSISEQFYGIPKDQVIGTTFKYKFVSSDRTLMRMPEVELFNDKEKKPVAIQMHIGQRPVLACGNEGGGGDIAMLEYCQGNRYLSLQLLINHDDSVREFFYYEADSASLKAAAKNKWHVVSMKNDWKDIFAEGSN